MIDGSTDRGCARALFRLDPFRGPARGGRRGRTSRARAAPARRQVSADERNTQEFSACLRTFHQTGGHQPDEPTSTTEIVGVCTLPAFRRRGFGLALTATLAIDARERGLRDVWLSAASDDVAQLYGRVGFERVGTYVMAALDLSGS